MSLLQEVRQGLADLHQIRLVLEALYVESHDLDGTAITPTERASRERFFNTTSTATFAESGPSQEALREHEAEIARRARRN